MANKQDPDNHAPPVKLPTLLRWVVVGLVLMACGVTARRVWDSVQTELANSPRYKITADVLHLQPEVQPPWIRTDIKAQVLRDSGISDSLTLLDDPATIHRRLIDAFELNPWIRRVEQVDLAGPRRIDLVIAYREPVAVAEFSAAGHSELLPLDAYAVRLPDNDLSDIEKAYLPRIAGVEDRPLVGEAWGDQRMQGAAQLAAGLRNVWEELSLLDIIPSTYHEVERTHRFFTYDIRSSGGTIIHWGAAPGFGPPSESTFEEKLARLSGWIERNGGLDSIHSPQSIDVRRTLHVEKRLAKQKSPDDVVR